jgi:hypothetical protein
MMRVFYGMGKGNAHRYQCRGDDAHVGAGLCIGIGGVRIDRAGSLPPRCRSRNLCFGLSRTVAEGHHRRRRART